MKTSIYQVYLCNAIDEGLKNSRAISSDSPAATNKVFSIMRAFKRAGGYPFILSLGRGGQNGSCNFYRPVTKNIYDIPVYYCAFFQAPFFTHIVSAVSVSAQILRMHLKGELNAVLVYNRSLHFIPALCLIKIFGVRCYLDLEDGFNLQNPNWVQLLFGKSKRFLFDLLCSSGAMVATSGLGADFKKCSPLVCHGVADNVFISPKDWGNSFIKIIFSGTLLEEVGCQLLLEAIKQLPVRHPDSISSIKILVTGKGSWGKKFQEFSTQSNGLLTFGGLYSNMNYQKILREAHVGLSLRLSRFKMANTTFPSKIIEYANYGLLVVTTSSDDILNLFDKGALYLKSETPEALADLLASIPQRRDELSSVAKLGQSQVLNVCSPEIVGQSIRDLMCPDNERNVLKDVLNS